MAGIKKEEKMSDNDKAIATVMAESPMLYQPQTVVKDATNAATVLMQVVEDKKLYQQIGQKKHLEFEPWQMIGAFFGATPVVEWVRPIVTDGITFGYEARVQIVNAQGRPISAAEGDCRTEEPNWAHKPLFQLKSMAQTRAAAKALRMAFAWVAVLGGYSPTPAEEMIAEKRAEVDSRRAANPTPPRGRLKTDTARNPDIPPVQDAAKRARWDSLVSQSPMSIQEANAWLQKQFGGMFSEIAFSYQDQAIRMLEEKLEAHKNKPDRLPFEPEGTAETPDEE
jgi:hypothetical protein